MPYFPTITTHPLLIIEIQVYNYKHFKPLNLWGMQHFEGMKVMCLGPLLGSET